MLKNTTEYLRRRRVELTILACMCAIYFFSYFQRVAIPGTIFDELQSDFQTSANAVAWLGAMCFYIYGAMQLVAGLLSDRFGAAKVLLGGGLLLSLGSIAFPLSPSLPFLYASRALVGLGASLIYISIVKALDGLFGADNFAQYLGIALFLGYSGGLAGTFPFERLVSLMRWRPALLLVGILCAIAVTAAAVLFRATGRMQHRGAPPPLRVVPEILRNRESVLILIVGSGSFSVSFLVLTTIGKKFLVDYAGMTSSAAAACTFLMMLVTMLATLSSGFLSRHLNNRRKPIVMASSLFVVMAVSLLLICLEYGVRGVWFLPSYVLLGLGGIGFPMSSALVKELNRPEAVGASTGVLNGACYLTVAVVTNLVGLIMDRFEAGAVKTASAVIYPKEAYVGIAVLCLVIALISLIAAFFLRETHGRSLYAEN